MTNRIKTLEDALRELLHAVCGDTGFAACVRADSGKAYPWHGLDIAEANARAALAASQPAQPVAVKVKRMGWWCDPCRSVGMMHCSDPENCGFMRTASAKADDWKSWLDDLPLPDDFSQGIDMLQDFITHIMAAIDVQHLTVQDAARVPEIAALIEKSEALRDDVTSRVDAFGDRIGIAQPMIGFGAKQWADFVAALRAIAEGR